MCVCALHGCERTGRLSNFSEFAVNEMRIGAHAGEIVRAFRLVQKPGALSLPRLFVLRQELEADSFNSPAGLQRSAPSRGTCDSNLCCRIGEKSRCVSGKLPYHSQFGMNDSPSAVNCEGITAVEQPLGSPRRLPEVTRR